MRLFFNLLYAVATLLIIAACTSTQTSAPKSSWKVLTKDATSNMAIQKANFVPSGTELIFTVDKNFTEKDNHLNISLSPQKRCSLSTSFEKQPEISLTKNTVLTVVGYRGETNDLVLSEPSYQQYFISCMSKKIIRKTSSVKNSKKVIPKAEWKKSSVEASDIEKMSPLLTLKFIPQ